MHALLVSVFLMGGDFAAGPVVVPPAVVQAVSADVVTGTLLFSEGDCLAIRAYTASPYTHVAAVVVHDGKPVVYDAMNGVGVRCQPLSSYLATQGADTVEVHCPCRKFSRAQAAAFEDMLVSRMGTPYSVTHFVTGQKRGALHCSELVSDALVEAQTIRVKNSARVSPASLEAGLRNSGLYVRQRTILLNSQPTAPMAEPQTCCGRWWSATKQTFQSGGKKVKGWLLCK